MNRLLEFRIWGSLPHCEAINELTDDLLVQRVLFAVRNVPKSAGQIADEIHADRRSVQDAIARLYRYHLIGRTGSDRKWEASISIFSMDEIRVAQELGRNYGDIEATILRSAIPRVRTVFQGCSLATKYSWESMSRIIIGGLIADFCVFDRVRFRSGVRDESLLPPRRPDGTRWAYTGFELCNEKVYPAVKWEFYHNVSQDSAGGFARWGYFGERRVPRPSQPEDVLFHDGTREIVTQLSRRPLSFGEICARTGLSRAVAEEKIQELSSFDPPAVLKQDDAFVLDLPVLSEDDFQVLLRTGDEVAEIVHNQVVLPYHRERIRRSKDLGLKTVFPGDTLAREFALQSLIEEGDLPPPPVAPVPWHAGVWGWFGHLAMWDDAA
jgi:hypothetical protein